MIRLGIIGTNWITDKFLAALDEVDGIKLTAIYSRTAEKAQTFANKYNVANFYSHLNAFCESPNIDAVYIASPNALHKDQAVLCMKNGKHVLCEKPLASNTQEVKQMIQTAQTCNVLLMEALKSTFTPTFFAIKQNLHKIAPIRQITASYGQYSSRYDLFKSGELPNAFNLELSNGALMDLGVYCIYPIVSLFGEPEKVFAHGVKLRSGVDGAATVQLGYPAMNAVVSFSKISNSEHKVEIMGEQGTLQYQQVSDPSWAIIRYRNGEIEELTARQGENTMRYEIREFVHLIHQNKLQSEVNSFVSSLAVMKVMDAARQQMGIRYLAD